MPAQVCKLGTRLRSAVLSSPLLASACPTLCALLEAAEVARWQAPQAPPLLGGGVEGGARGPSAGADNLFETPSAAGGGGLVVAAGEGRSAGGGGGGRPAGAAWGAANRERARDALLTLARGAAVVAGAVAAEVLQGALMQVRMSV